MKNRNLKRTKNVPRPESLAKWLEYIETLHPEDIELSLERIRKVFQRLTIIPAATTVITIAGTNGKGSTVVFLEKFFLAAGYTVGAYTSPHLLDFNERIRINNKNATDAELTHAFEKINEVRGDDALTYFEFTTLAAFFLFFKSNLDILILEVGMGGRLDATNILDPDISIITTVDIDHSDWLGADRESIAREKAGILRQQTPIVYGDTQIPKTVKNLANQLQAPLYEYDKDFLISNNPSGWNWTGAGETRSGLPLPALQGQHQLKNAATALMTLALLQPERPVGQQAIKSGLLAAILPGRFQVLSSHPQIIFDVAHNPQATKNLADTALKQNWPGRTLAVVGMLSDKDIEQTLCPMMAIVDEWFLADLTGVNQSRGLSVQSLSAIVVKMNKEIPLSACESPLAAYNAALEKAMSDDRIIVFGSFSTVGGILDKIQ